MSQRQQTFLFDSIPAEEVDEPVFGISEVAKIFFRRSSHWVRWRERKGSFTLDGKEVDPQRTKGGARQYLLPDIERMAHALAQSGAIDGEELARVIRVVHAIGVLYDYDLPEPA